MKGQTSDIFPQTESLDNWEDLIVEKSTIAFVTYELFGNFLKFFSETMYICGFFTNAFQRMEYLAKSATLAKVRHILFHHGSLGHRKIYVGPMPK